MNRRRLTLSAVAVLAGVAAAWGGGIVAIAVVILLFPLLGWAFDNDSGTFFLLGLLVTIALIVLIVLVSLMALVH